MATLVFRSAVGPLIPTQVGAADLVATFHAAHAAYGWLGGLDSVRYLINVITNTFSPGSTKVLSLQPAAQLRLIPTQVHVLTSAGPQELHIDDAAQSFGNDPRTQLIGLSICALAHELGGERAVQLFTQYLAVRLFEAPAELIDTLEVQLSEQTTIQRIINEGASRGYTKLFIDAVLASEIPSGDHAWIKRKCGELGTTIDRTETYMVGGLIKWISGDSTSPYFTRSGLVARTAIYLRTVGYMFGQIKTWDGNGNAPSGLGPNAVVLVLGGSYQTDILMLTEDTQESIFTPINVVHYYTSSTIGSLLVNALRIPANISAERLQDDFDFIRYYLSSNMKVKWEIHPRPLRKGANPAKIAATGFLIGSEWDGIPDSSSFERSLAGIHFPNSGDFLAPCYRRIANESVLSQVRDGNQRNINASDEDLPTEIARFRAVTASIVIGLISCLAPDTFTNTQHGTLLQLTDQTWLEDMCGDVDQFACGYISMSTAVLYLAAIHAGRDPGSRKSEKKPGDIVGFRNGIFSILPTLLHKVEPIQASLGFTLSDRFFANLVLLDNGAMTDIVHSFVFPDQSDSFYTEKSGDSPLVSLRRPWAGQPHQSPPDRSLYLSLERPPFGVCPQIGFVGRIDGSVIGRVSIMDILYTLIRSFQPVQACDHIDEKILVKNVTASRWALKSKIYKPTGSVEVPAYISVKDDKCWALFLAGESKFLNGIVVDRCASCALNMLHAKQPLRGDVNHDMGVLIGYGG